MKTHLFIPELGHKKSRKQSAPIIATSLFCYFLQLLFNSKSISLMVVVDAAPVPEPSSLPHHQNVSGSGFTAVNMVKSLRRCQFPVIFSVPKLHSLAAGFSATLRLLVSGRIKHCSPAQRVSCEGGDKKCAAIRCDSPNGSFGRGDKKSW